MNRTRTKLISFCLFLFFGTLVFKLYDIQINKHEYYSSRAFRQQFDTLIVKAERGTILDRFGDALVYTNDQYSFYADTRMLKPFQKDSVVSLFSRTFNESENYFRSLLSGKKGNVCLWKKADKEKAFILNSTTIDGIFYEADYSRNYPYNGLAAHVLGYVNRDMSGIDGIESEYNDVLTGKDGFKRIERDVVGRPVSLDDESSQRPVAGHNVHLTINKTYQQILEEELFFGIKAAKAKSGVGIIMNPKTGEILALANMPTYDPKNYNVFDDLDRKNIAVMDIYEPGSTMKSIAMAILLNEKLVRESEVINTENGVYKIKGARITDDHKYAQLNVREIIEHSSNIGMTKLSDRVDNRTFYKYLRDFGFGMPTYIDLPGEVPGILRTPDKYSATSKYFMSFGYEIAVTPIQLLSAYSALVNGGLLYKPYIVQKITDEFGNTIQETKPILIRKVIDSETSKRIKSFMIGVVEQGTGQQAGITNVKSGGKTGTSQRWSGKEYLKDYNASYIGFLPADNPQLVCSIVIYSPSNGKYGGTIAAPIFRNAMNRIVESDINLLPDNVIKDENEYRIFERVTFTGGGNTIKDYANPSNEETETRKKNDKETAATRSTMPNLDGYSVREAVAIIAEMGLKSKVQGRGRVVYQSIPPGTKIEKGNMCEIKCRFETKSGNKSTE